MRSIKISIQFLLSLLIIYSCGKKEPVVNDNRQIVLPVLNLKKPDTILNDIAKGQFNSQLITSLHFQNFNHIPKIWGFEVFPNTTRIKTVKLNLKPGSPFLCEEPTWHFKYQNNLIDEIEYIRINVCLVYKVNILLKYNYESNVLVSITAKGYYSDSTVSNKPMLVGENYFSYNSDGTVFEIYASMRSIDQPLYGYSKITLFYDSNKNVIESWGQDYSTNQYDKKYTFEYDNNTNPLKGIYVFSWMLNDLPNNGVESILGPNYLSNNCIKTVKIENLNRPTPFPYILNFTSNKSNNTITDFGSDLNYQYWFRNYLY